MFYTPKKEPMTLLTEKTLAEKLTGRFNMNDQPSNWQVKRFYIAFVLCVIMSLCHFVQANAESFDSIQVEDGAGTYWTCSKCGNSNKCYEMSCGRCGASR